MQTLSAEDKERFEKIKKLGDWELMFEFAFTLGRLQGTKDTIKQIKNDLCE
jgi:hypothetical protein